MDSSINDEKVEIGKIEKTINFIQCKELENSEFSIFKEMSSCPKIRLKKSDQSKLAINFIF